METTEKTTLFNDRLAWGVTLLAVSMLLEVILGIYGITNLNVEFDPDMVSAPTFSPLQTVMGCLTPINTVARLVGVLLIALGSRQIGGRQRLLAWGGFGLFLFSLLLTAVALCLSISATTQGSLSALVTATWVSILGTLLAYGGLALMVVQLSPPALRALLVAALVLFIAAQVGSVLITAGSMTMESYEMYGTTYYFPSINVDRTTGIMPALSIASVAGQGLLLAAFAALAISGWRELGSALPETVS